MTSRGTAEFWGLYRELPPQIRGAAQEAFKKFLENPAHPGLQLERLKFALGRYGSRGIIVLSPDATATTIGSGFGLVRMKNLIVVFRNDLVFHALDHLLKLREDKPVPLWGRTGFDLIDTPEAACRGRFVGLVNHRTKK